MRQSNAYVIGFATATCVVCSLMLSVVSGVLRDRQEQNRILDRQKNILMAVGYAPEELSKKKAAEILELYQQSFEELVIDRQGNVVESKKPSDLDPKEASGEAKDPKHLPLFRQKDPNDPAKTLAYVYPVAGKGLWSTLYGYLAVKPDGSEIVGIAFFKHGETPGLGAEIEKEWFTSNFKGKRLYEGGKIVGVEVVKGRVADKVMSAEQQRHAVDGISGATLTSNGVTKMLQAMPLRYDPFFKKLQQGQTAMFWEAAR